MNRKKNIRKILKNPVKKEILDYLLTEDGAYYGDLVMSLDENQLTILENLIELKRMGWIYKDTDGGRFRLNEEYFSKRTDPEKQFGSDSERLTWTVVDEMNSFAEKTNPKPDEAEADNEINIDKKAPKAQKVNQNKKIE